MVSNLSSKTLFTFSTNGALKVSSQRWCKGRKRGEKISFPDIILFQEVISLENFMFHQTAIKGFLSTWSWCLFLTPLWLNFWILCTWVSASTLNYFLTLLNVGFCFFKTKYFSLKYFLKNLGPHQETWNLPIPASITVF